MERTEQLHQTLKHFFGFDTFKDQQLDIINSVLSGHDTFVLMPTGGGKSLCYQLPALLMDGTAVIISPLIALMKNQVDSVRSCSNNDSIAHFINSSLSKAKLDQVHDDLRSGRTKMLFVAPESLTKADNIDLLREISVSFYAVDEAHCISEWGHDFRPEYRRIRTVVDEIMPRPIIALTATATPQVQADIVRSLCLDHADLYMSSFNRPNLYYELRPKNDDTDREIIKYVKGRTGTTGIIYCMSRQKVETMAEVLKANGIKTLPYHAGIDSKVRVETQDAFLNEEIDVIVATIAFGMGIDKPDVRYVIHYDIPKSLESYYQETGRAGRDGGKGECICYYSRSDVKKMEKLLQSKNKSQSEREVGKQLLDEIEQYAETPICRRKFILHYFGEEYSQDNCHNCDNCTSQNRQVQAKDTLVSVLSSITALKEEFKPEYIIDFLLGKTTTDIQNYNHDQLEDFASCKGEERSYIETVIRQAMIDGYINKNSEKYGVLEITSKGKSFLKKPSSFMVTMPDDSEVEIQEEKSNGSGSGAADPVLFSVLKDLCKKTAKKLNLPPYVVFQESSLQDMATFYPINMTELQNITGVGQSKAQKYGEPFIKVIEEYVRENDIERPEDIRIRTVANKSKLKVAIVQLIDRKVSLEDIANTHNLDFGELLDEIESIIYSGTKINLNYFISDVMDEEDIEEIYDYFKHSTTDDLDTAMGELGHYEEDEIRLVRIKFISEMAN